MKRTTNAFEAVMLYREPGDISLTRLAAPMAEMANAFGFARGAVQKAGPGDILFQGDDLRLVISIVERPLADTRLETAERPPAAVISRREINKRTAAHEAAVVIRCTAGNSVDATGRAMQLCNEMALLFAARTPVSVVYWSRTDRIYAGEEYRASTGGHAPVRPRRPERAYLSPGRSMAARPALPLLLPTEAAAEVQPEELPPYEIAVQRLEEIKGEAFPRDAIRAAAEAHTGETPVSRALGGAAVAALSAPLALGALMQTLVDSIKLG